MNVNKQDISGPALDQGESPTIMEPMTIAVESRFRGALNDLAIDLAAKASGFRQKLPQKIVPILATLVRGMNCYYSNLIEGHDTHPVDIERALKEDFSKNSHKRDLQLEARAHIEVQGWIDNGGMLGAPATTANLLALHKRFCCLLPADLLWASDQKNNTSIQVVPGSLRDRDVQVGQHIPIRAGAIPRFLERFEKTYSSLGRADTIINVAAAHHRLLWIHPFLDGNGRVARLFSHAMLLNALDTGGIWSISRGLARNDHKYKSLLANCDQPRRNDLDGRGHLSEESLVKFTQFFMETCLDQIAFMENLMTPTRLTERILAWATEQIHLGHLPKKSGKLLEMILYRGGELARREVPEILDVGTRQARRIVATLLKEEALTSASSRAPLSLNFPARLAGHWMPGLFPEK